MFEQIPVAAVFGQLDGGLLWRTFADWSWRVFVGLCESPVNAVWATSSAPQCVFDRGHIAFDEQFCSQSVRQFDGKFPFPIAIHRELSNKSIEAQVLDICRETATMMIMMMIIIRVSITTVAHYCES